MVTPPDLVNAISVLGRQRPVIVVGISGFGGSGKSTLARQLVDSIEGSARIRGDDFLDPARSHQRSADWDGVDRVRLRAEVLDPFRAGQQGFFRRFDWSARQLGKSEPIPDARILVVDAIGLLHPELDGALDLTIWIDVDLDLATKRGKARDKKLGRSHEGLWDEVWVPNERDFVARFDPRARADYLFESA